MSSTTAIEATDALDIPHPPEVVWRVVADVAAYPDWWPSALRLQVLHAEPEVVGTEVEIHPVGGQSFRVRVLSVDPPAAMRLEYYGGFLTGHGLWRLEAAPGGTRVHYDLDARADGWVVAMLARLMPLPRLHSELMQSVLRELARVCDMVDEG